MSEIKETKAQRVERLKRAKNAWECVDEIREFARLGPRFDSSGVAGNLFSFVGDLHPGRWAGRDWRRER